MGTFGTQLLISGLIILVLLGKGSAFFSLGMKRGIPFPDHMIDFCLQKKHQFGSSFLKVDDLEDITLFSNI